MTLHELMGVGLTRRGRSVCMPLGEPGVVTMQVYCDLLNHAETLRKPGEDLQVVADRLLGDWLRDQAQGTT